MIQLELLLDPEECFLSENTNKFISILRPLLFWDVIWHRLVDGYEHFGTACWCHLKGSCSLKE